MLLDSRESTAITTHFHKATTPPIFEPAMKHVPMCRDKNFCNKIKLNNNTCRLLEYIRKDCPVSCKICPSCQDDKKCNLIPDIRIICLYHPEASKMCPQSCGVCNNWNREFGKLFHDIKLQVAFNSKIVN